MTSGPTGTADPTTDVRIGVDLGGTKCLGVAIDGDGQIIREVRRPTPAGADAVIDAIVEVAAELGDGFGSASAVGVGVPGLVTRDGVLRAAPNLPGVDDLHVADLLLERLGGEVAVDNDNTCATLAEWQHGAARGADEVLFVALGTGIGGGVVSGGRLQRGEHGFTGEFGHMVVDPNGPPCVCGRRGCWERYSSGAGLARLAREAAFSRRAARVVTLAGGDPELVRGEHVQRAALERDPDALAVIDEFGRWVALGLVNLTNALDPGTIVLGGGLSTGADLYLDPIRRWFVELLYSPDLRPHPELVIAQLGEHAGAVGAALLHDP